MNNHEEHNAQNIANEEEKSENEGTSGYEKENDIEDKIGEQANDSIEEENLNEEDEVSESEAPSEETGEEARAQEPGSLPTPFTGDEEVSSDEDDVPLSKVGKKSRKTLVKTTKNKRKVVDAQISKESRSVKKPKKKVSIVKPVGEVDREDESDSALPAKSTTPKKKGAKVTKSVISYARASRGKTRKNVPAVVD
ncbi:ribosomal RNA-processing protein 15-like [Nicotiana tomentosiformis]|uniref:ribosomal RNA-processing protein 15-like n=1 Tax=Nicotiana tomentosiformis TaxID=4098 RepID=UPI00388CA3FC